MGQIVSLILFITGIILHKKSKIWFAPDVLFCYMWSAITLLSSLHLYGMYESSSFVYLIVMIGSLSFVGGVLWSYRFSIRPSRIVDVTTQDFIPKTIFWISLLYIFSLRFEPFTKSLALQLSGIDLQTIRTEFFNQSLSVMDVLNNTFESLLGPMVEVAGIVYFVRDIRHNYIYFVVVLLLTLMESVIDGGRFGLSFLIIELVICFSIVRKRPNLSLVNPEQYKSKIIKYVLFIASVILVITFLRGAETYELLKKYYRYFCGNIIFFDNHISIIKQLPLFPFGVSLFGFWFLFFPLLNVFGFSYPKWYISVNDNVMNTQDFFQIGDDMYTNAFSTPFYYLYADMRLFGVIIGMIIFGIFAGIAYKKMLINTKNKYLIIYIIVCQMIFMTIYFYPFSNTGYLLIVVYLLFLRLIRTK